MRQLTSIEFEAFVQARLKYENDNLFNKPDNRAGFSAGFTAALEHTDTQLASLTAERDGLRAALGPFADNAEVWEENESHFVLVYSRRGVKGKPDLMIMVGDLLEARRALREPLRLHSGCTQDATLEEK